MRYHNLKQMRNPDKQLAKAKAIHGDKYIYNEALKAATTTELTTLYALYTANLRQPGIDIYPKNMVAQSVTHRHNEILVILLKNG